MYMGKKVVCGLVFIQQTIKNNQLNFPIMSRCQAWIWEASLDVIWSFSWFHWRQLCSLDKSSYHLSVTNLELQIMWRRTRPIIYIHVWSSMLIYCCKRANLLPLAVVKYTTPVQVLYLPSVPCDGPLTYPDSTTDSRSLASLWKYNTSLWHLCRPSVCFDSGSSNTHEMEPSWRTVPPTLAWEYGT